MPSNIVQLDPYKVQNITVLKRPDAANAQRLMEQVAKQVQPILRRRKWRVRQLTEFNRKGLLGMNTGGGGGNTHLINLRLRETRDSTVMLPYSCILGTMLHGSGPGKTIEAACKGNSSCSIGLGTTATSCNSFSCCWSGDVLQRHVCYYLCTCVDASACSAVSFMPHAELAHNIRGPHDTIFYKLLDELKEECQDYMDRSISGTGAGFDAMSVGRLGGRGPVAVHNPDPRNLRQVALKAAEERARKQSVMFAGPRVVGGSANFRGLTPAQAAARAAERRAVDEKWCASAASPAAELAHASTSTPLTSISAPQGPSTKHPGPSSSGVPAVVAAPPANAHAALLGGINGSGCGCCIDLTTEECDDSDVEMLENDDVAPADMSLDDVMLPSVPLRNPSVASTPLSGNSSSRFVSTEFDTKSSEQGRSCTNRGPSDPARKPTDGFQRGNPLQGGRRAALNWQCTVCTLNNTLDAMHCAACGEPVPANLSVPESHTGPAAHPGSVSSVVHQSVQGSEWACSVCTLSNDRESDRCVACDTWRFSRTMPAAMGL